MGLKGLDTAGLDPRDGAGEAVIDIDCEKKIDKKFLEK